MDVLAVDDLHTYFFTRDGVVKAVNGVSFTLKAESTLGIVGESGCGKTMTVLSIMGLVPFPGRIVKGEIGFDGRDLLHMDKEEMRRLRGREIAMIFQDPMGGLNPVIPVGTQMEEVFTTHLEVSRAQAREMAVVTLSRMGLPVPERLISQYPFQLSGGMCQRVMIAMAMALGPKVLIADEATTALDVTLQARILDELQRLKVEQHAAIVFITHDLGVIARMAEEVAVMYAGSVVEYADVLSLFRTPTHPYTWALMQALPRLDDRRSLRTIRGAPPNLLDLPDQCPFIPRCHKARSQCRTSPRPPLQARAPRHLVACYNPMSYPED